MKKNTLLTMLFALFGVMAFAQKDLGRLPQSNTQVPNVFKCIDRDIASANFATRNADVELVTPPATAQVEKWHAQPFLANEQRSPTARLWRNADL